jgi:hypothetical protein
MPPITIEDNSGIVRVTLGDISPAGDDSDFGLKIVSSDGTTVIIDGTSDVFRIQATGTLSKTQATGGSGSTVVTLTALGLLNNPPAFASFIGDGTTGYSTPGQIQYDPFLAYAAVTSAGAVTTRVVASQFVCDVRTYLSGAAPANANVGLTVSNTIGSTVTQQARYYILVQTAL